MQEKTLANSEVNKFRNFPQDINSGNPSSYFITIILQTKKHLIVVQQG